MAMESHSNCLFITYVEKEGPFLKVWGQTDKNTSLYIEQFLHSVTAQFDNGLAIPHPESLHVGILCCAKYKDNKYYRARITSLNFLHNRYIEVNFVDYGHQDVVPLSNIRSLEGFDNSFLSIQPQAASFLLAEAVCPRGEWNEAYLEEISKETRYSEVNFSIIAQVTKHYLVRLFVGVNDLAILLISKGLMRHTSLTTQEAVLLSMMPRTTGPVQPPTQQSIVAYKAFTLEPGSQYEVYVSYVTDGPCNFSVQLKQSEEILGKLMKEINSMNLTQLEELPPIPGTVCLARCMEDGHICRAVVTSEVDSQYKVFYVDFGNFEVNSAENLYEIPFKYVIPKVMAIRFALAGVEKSTVTLEMQCAFKQFVDNRLMHMKVMPMTTRTSLPRCELWDPESQISALDIVNQAAASAYPEHISLNRGFSQSVKISYVFSCNRLYVQLKSKQDDLLRLMLDIQVLCRDSDSLSPQSIKIGLPCYALFEGDQQWYRSQIVEVLGGGQVKVQYVDYGNEEVVASSLLKPIEGKQLTVLRPQAIECCLNGYQNMEPDLERDNLLEELILEQEFTMKVVEMQGKKALVELIDGANYNVASLLLDKIAMTRSQVSPMLVQAGNKIEHRKSFSKEQRSSERAQRQWAESNEQPGWRQESRGQRNRNNTEASDNNENNTWRQNNKTFNKNYDRNRRDDDLNDSTESERSHKGYNTRNDRNKNEFNSRQNSKGFNSRNQDRQNRNDWGGSEDERRNFKEKDGFDSGRESDRQNNRNSPDDWGKGNDKFGGEKRRHFQGRDNRGGAFEKRNFQPRDQDSWGDNNDRKSFSSKEQGSWGGGADNNDDWGGNKNDNWSERKSFKDRDNFRKPRDRFDNDNERDTFRKPRERYDNNNDRDSYRKPRDETGGGFRKRPDFKREKSELSSSGSEKSFRKGFKDNNNRNQKRDNFGKQFGGGPKGDDSWNVGGGAVEEVPDAAPNTAAFASLSVEQTESNVIISWFHNPTHFYCQVETFQDDFRKMMETIQQAYKDRTPNSSSAIVGAPIIALFPEDKVLYRAQILEIVGSQFKVYYVDFGNVSTVNKIWPIELRFMELPAQAVCCKLDGIKAPGDSWSDANQFGPYFDKKQLLCRFFTTNNDDRVLVQLEHNGENIGSLLLKDGLAEPLAISQPPEIAFLIGQQFRAMLLSVNSLADFVVSLQSGVLLNCGVFNLGVSTETWENNLKEKLGQILIVYVDDLKDDRLEVTVYDQNGSKIKLIDQDEEAFDSVELLCPYTVLYSTLLGEVAHAEENTAYIQPSDCSPNMEYLLNAVYEFYENSVLENPIVPVEGFVYAVKGSDTNWYRGRVTTFDDNQATVNYLDYGNSEQVELGALRELTAEFMEIPIMSVPVREVILDAPATDFIGQTLTVDITFTESGISGTIRCEQTSELQVPVPDVIPETNEAAPEAPSEVLKSVPKPSGTQVILSHIDSPSDFYLQLAESVTVIEELQAQLQDQVGEMPDMDNPTVGVLCAAPYSLDQQWYRAQVLDADVDITTVRFVDYGNTDVLDNHTTRVKTLPPNLLSLEVHATRSRLKVKPVEEEWSTAASKRFDELCNTETLTARFINQDEKTNYVELFADDINVGEVLIRENLALTDEILHETKTIGFVSHLNSPSEFWIQLENCIDELEWIAEQLSAAESFSELEELAPGTLCAALFPDDQMWYRARILSNTVAGIEVLFVDYGNSCTSCSLKELPEDLVMMPPLAQKCSLQKPEGLIGWSPEMAKKFSEISADGQTTFNVKKLGTGETASVELSLDGVDVATMLLPEVVDVKVKSFSGLDDLVLIQGDEELPTKFKLEPIVDSAWSEDSVTKFSELNDDGKRVFQAEFVSHDTVRLYIGLNDIRLDLNASKTYQTHSTDVTSINNVESIVNDLVETILDKKDDAGFVKSLVTDIVEQSTGCNSEITANSLVGDILEENTNRSISESIVAEIIEQSTQSFQSIEVEVCKERKASDFDSSLENEDVSGPKTSDTSSPTKTVEEKTELEETPSLPSTAIDSILPAGLIKSSTEESPSKIEESTIPTVPSETEIDYKDTKSGNQNEDTPNKISESAESIDKSQKNETETVVSSESIPESPKKIDGEVNGSVDHHLT